MTRRRNTLKLAFLTTALALIALCLAVLACAPAAPAGQNGAAGTLAPEPTTEAATYTTATPAPPATSAPEPTPADTPTPSRTPRLNDNAYAILALSEVVGSNGTTSTFRLPDEIYAGFGVRAAHRDDFVQFLSDNGAAITAMPYGGPAVYAVSARIAPSLLGPATQHPAFVSGYTGGLYPKMAGLLDNVITEYTLGQLTVCRAAEIINGRLYETAPDYVNVVINLETAGESDALRAFLKANQAGADPKVAGEFQFTASVPVPVMPQLALREDVSLITRERVERTNIWEPTREWTSACP